MNKRLKWGLGVIVVAVIASELLLPWLVSIFIARSMIGIVGTDQVAATIEKRPALAMVTGQFDRVAIKAQGAKLDKIMFDELDAVLTDVRLDQQALLVNRQLVVKSARNVEMTAVLSQEELSRFLNQSVKGVKNAVVTVDGGQVKVNAEFGIGGIASLAVTLEGRVAADNQKIKFVTDRFLINHTLVGKIGGIALTEIPLVDLKKLPFGVMVSNISMEQGKVTVFADNQSK